MGRMGGRGELLRRRCVCSWLGVSSWLGQRTKSLRVRCQPLPRTSCTCPPGSHTQSGCPSRAQYRAGSARRRRWPEGRQNTADREPSNHARACMPKSICCAPSFSGPWVRPKSPSACPSPWKDQLQGKDTRVSIQHFRRRQFVFRTVFACSESVIVGKGLSKAVKHSHRGGRRTHSCEAGWLAGWQHEGSGGSSESEHKFVPQSQASSASRLGSRAALTRTGRKHKTVQYCAFFSRNGTGRRRRRPRRSRRRRCLRRRADHETPSISMSISHRRSSRRNGIRNLVH